MRSRPAAMFVLQCAWLALSACGDEGDGSNASAGAGGLVGAGGSGGTGGVVGQAGSGAGASAAGGTSSAGTTGSAGGAGSAAGGAGGEGAFGGEQSGGAGAASGACSPAATGTWELGDDNLYMVVGEGCVVTNFCDIMHDIHSTGTLDDTTLVVDSVAGSPVSFGYTLAGDTLTLLDATSVGQDLPLSRAEASVLPGIECPNPTP